MDIQIKGNKGSEKPYYLNNPLVSVAVITYNQENTVCQTLESILSQKCNFDFEIIICDDHSSDNTPSILMEYKKKFPERIQLIINNENVGLIKNYYKAITLCRGVFIAQCAGDDFWNRDDKLEIQINLIKCDDNIGLIHSDSDFLYEETGKIIRNKNKRSQTLIPDTNIFEHLLLNNFIIAPTVLFRKEVFEKIDINELIKLNFMMEDYPLWLEISNHYKICYIDSSTVCYRVSNNSISRKNNDLRKLDFFVSSIEVREYFIKKYKPTNIKQIKTKDYKTLLLKSRVIKLSVNKHKNLLFYGFMYLMIHRKISFADFKNFIISIFQF